MPNPPLVASSPTATPSNSLSSSVFDGSIDHVWISFPEPPHQTHSTSNSFKRTRASGSTNATTPTPKKLFSYTRYDWNFLSTLSPTVLGWFCVINRIQTPLAEFIQQREKRIDAILAYFLIETSPKSTLPVSKFQELFSPKTKFLLSQPVCQLVSELRKHSNRKPQMQSDLQADLIPEIEILKQGIREACRGWAQTVKQSSQPQTGQSNNNVVVTNTLPINNHLPTHDPEVPPAVVRAPTMVDRVQRFIGHEFVIAHPKQPSIYANRAPDGSDYSAPNGSAIRRRTATQNPRKETAIEMMPDGTESMGNGERRRASSFLGKRTND